MILIIFSLLTLWLTKPVKVWKHVHLSSLSNCLQYVFDVCSEHKVVSAVHFLLLLEQFYSSLYIELRVFPWHKENYCWFPDISKFWWLCGYCTLVWWSALQTTKLSPVHRSFGWFESSSITQSKIKIKTKLHVCIYWYFTPGVYKVLYKRECIYVIKSSPAFLRRIKED
jgi:hypothetical protein